MIAPFPHFVDQAPSSPPATKVTKPRFSDTRKIFDEVRNLDLRMRALQRFTEDAPFAQLHQCVAGVLAM
jgi:hypothetical protein